MALPFYRKIRDLMRLTRARQTTSTSRCPVFMVFPKNSTFQKQIFDFGLENRGHLQGEGPSCALPFVIQPKEATEDKIIPFLGWRSLRMPNPEPYRQLHTDRGKSQFKSQLPQFSRLAKCLKNFIASQKIPLPSNRIPDFSF
jgi:hypothetical protein